MKKLSRRQLLISLIFSIMTTVWGLFNLALNLFYNFVVDYRVFGFSEIVYISAVVIGGILCTVLTITLGIETGKYFLPRLLTLISVIFVIAVVREFIYDVPMFEYILVIISLVFSAVYFKNKTTFSEWIIIFLSNPVLYYVCCDIEIIIYSFSDNGNSLF